jgi:microcystin degradation protein MlrC
MSPESITKPRVAIIGIYHESNTFISEPTTLAHYEASIFLLGEEIRLCYGRAHHEISGFLQTLDSAGMDVVPIIFAQTAPWGKVSDEALDHFWKLISEGLDKAGHLDGILVAPHGAAVNESRHDMDGWWLGELRKKVGEKIPVISTMDPHVNFSPAMAKACNAFIAYRENPHLDQFACGVEAATLMLRTLRGEIEPVSAVSFPPVVINIERQLTRDEPMLLVQAELERVRRLPGVLSASVTLGFPYADVPEMGSAFVVVTDNRPDLARKEADRLADWLIESRELFRGELISPEEALKRIHSSPKPVGLLDMGDNTGGGAPSDSTVLARLFEESGQYQVFVCLADADSVQAARKAGAGARLRMRLGGKLPMSPAPPLEVEVEIIRVDEDGLFRETEPRHGGKTGGNLGATALVRSDRGLTILLTTRRVGPYSLQPLLTRGVSPEEFDAIILKGVHAPIGAYADVCPTMIRVNTPGVTTADMESLVYHNRRKPLFPFESDL